MLAIETFELEKTYTAGFWRNKRKCALRPLTLSVSQGEVFGYLGPNGAGKTTTLRLLMGLVNPSGGSFRVLGGSIRDPKIRSQIGFLPEQPYFYDYLTASELLNYYGHLSGITGRDLSKRVAQTLSRVGLVGSEKVQLRKFSKGMLQRIGIAQAILHDPPLLFFDEPMSGLDPLGRREVRDLIEELKLEGKTVFFSTHILSDAEALCDRVAILNKSQLLGIGVVADITSKVQDQVELVWHGSGATRAIEALGGKCRATGETVRGVVAANSVEAAIDALRRSKAQLVSVNPVRSTLEDYFMEKLASSPASQPTATSIGIEVAQ